MTTPVYICTGFLNSGKTTFIKDTLMNQEWIEDGKTIYIRCESGEFELSEEYREAKGMILFDIDDEEELSPEFFAKIEKEYHPAQVIIEYNGMWELYDIIDKEFPKNWEVQGVFSTINGETMDLYLKNMRNLMIGQLIESELIVVNRCDDTVDRSGFRRSMRVSNPQAQIIFEDPEGNIIPQTDEDLPYDINADVIVLDDQDFGVWYVDAFENPERYVGKEISFLAQIMRPQGMPATMIMCGRQIMTCCADDVEYFGYPTELPAAASIEQNSWMNVTVRFEFKAPKRWMQKSPVLTLLYLERAEQPEDEFVYLV